MEVWLYAMAKDNCSLKSAREMIWSKEDRYHLLLNKKYQIQEPVFLLRKRGEAHDHLRRQSYAPKNDDQIKRNMAFSKIQGLNVETFANNRPKKCAFCAESHGNDKCERVKTYSESIGKMTGVLNLKRRNIQRTNQNGCQNVSTVMDDVYVKKEKYT